MPYEKLPTGMTPATVRRAYEKTKDVIISEHGDPGYINITSILTKIIQDCGRFAERYASDCLYGIDSVSRLCEAKFETGMDIDEIVSFAIRDSGVDGNSFLLSRLADSRRPMCGYVYATPQYRRILAVRVKIGMMALYEGESERPRLTCELKDITHSFLYIDDADVEPDGHIRLPPYETGNPVPAGAP